MRVGLVVLGTFLLGSQIHFAAQSPTEILKEAVERSKMCQFRPEKTDFLKSPEVWETAMPEDKELIRGLTLKLMFREGRYDVAFSSLTSPRENTLTFFPWNGPKLPPGKHEDEDLNKILNNLRGSIEIDPKNGGVREVHANLAETGLGFWRRFYLLPYPITLYNLQLDFIQAKQGDVWVPQSFLLTASGHAAVKKVGEFYRGWRVQQFNCSSAAE